MTRYFNDSPIETAADDEYGISPFAESLAKSILNIRAPIGTTIALHGPWGSGKSSVVNLVRAELEKARDENLVVSDFKCWWFRGEEALALAFLQNLHALVADALPDPEELQTAQQWGGSNISEGSQASDPDVMSSLVELLAVLLRALWFAMWLIVEVIRGIYLIYRKR